MASSIEFVQYACDQLSGAGEITYKKMFGEYGVYCEGKIIGLICDDQLFIKKTEAGANIWPGLDEGSPYEGAKPHFLIEDLENTSLLTEFIRESYKELPMQKTRKKKSKE